MLLARALLCAMLVWSLAPLGARAQTYFPGWTASRIEAFEVRTVRHWVPGAMLHFSVFGLPEGQAVIRIEGASHSLRLQEADAGHYLGDYTLAADDRITPSSRVSVALRSILGLASVQLDGTLARSDEALRRLPPTQPLPLLGRVHIIPASAPTSGSRLKFVLEGAPAGAASMTISGLGPTILLSERAGSGHYFGSYTLRDYDAVTAFSVVSAALRVGSEVSRVSLGQYFQQITAPMPLLSERNLTDPRAMAQSAGQP
jgi:hypothetical protein